MIYLYIAGILFFWPLAYYNFFSGKYAEDRFADNSFALGFSLFWPLLAPLLTLVHIKIKIENFVLGKIEQKQKTQLQLLKQENDELKITIKQLTKESPYR